MNMESIIHEFQSTWAGWFLSCPMTVQLTGVFLVSWAAAWIINKHSRLISAWFDKLVKNIPNTVSPEEYLLRVKRVTIAESFFWTPLYGVFMAGIYYWFIQRGGIVNIAGQAESVSQFTKKILIEPIGLQNFISLFIFFGFLLSSSIIDVRRRIIPDSITVTGTVIGLLLFITPFWIQIPVTHFAYLDGGDLAPLPYKIVTPQFGFSSPFSEPAWAGGAYGMLAALGCWGLFIFTQFYRPLHFSRGFYRAVELYFIRLLREKRNYVIIVLGLLGLAYIPLVWHYGDGAIALSGFLGMAMGIVLVWTVRIIGRICLKMEALGFGDVTLMALIGAFTGWQAIPIIFFLSPVVGLAVGIIMLFFQARDVPFGPFLCLAAAFWILFFDSIWNYCLPLFLFGAPMVLFILLVCLFLMAVMLYGIRKIKEILFNINN